MFNHHLLTGQHRESHKEFSDFVQEHVLPFAGEWDRAQAVPRDVIGKCAKAGYIGGIIPKEFGGGGWDTLTFGLLNEAIGAASSDLCGLFTVQTMVASTLTKWGTKEQQEKYLPPMATGETLAAYVMTEPKVGSNIQEITTTFTPDGDGENTGYLLNGTKKWITFSGIADILLVFGKMAGTDKSMAAVVRADSPGITRTPLKDMLGFRGSYLSQIQFTDCRIEPGDVVGKPGLVLPYVAPFGLHYGRMSTAWHSIGLIRACLETASAYSSERQALSKPISNLGMIRELVTDIGVDLEAARLLGISAAMADDKHLPESMEKTLEAKYFASRAAVRAATNTIQILGAHGCSTEFPAERFYRNAKTLEIIEGTNQVIQNVLGKSFFRRFK